MLWFLGLLWFFFRFPRLLRSFLNKRRNWLFNSFLSHEKVHTPLWKKSKFPQAYWIMARLKTYIDGWVILGVRQARIHFHHLNFCYQNLDMTMKSGKQQITGFMKCIIFHDIASYASLYQAVVTVFFSEKKSHAHAQVCLK